MDLQHNEIHLWCVADENITDQALLLQYYSILDAQEKIEQEQFRLPQDRHQYLIARAMLKITLSTYVTYISPIDWRFVKNDHGKLFIANENIPYPIEFNLSHTKDKIVLTVTKGNAVGVDVEHISDGHFYLEIAKKYFTKSEYNDLTHQPLEKRNGYFLALWTLKEAYLKAIGKGLSERLDSFYYRFPQPDRIEFCSGQREDNNWKFWHLKQGNSHLISVAVYDALQDSKYQLNIYDLVPWGTKTAACYELISCTSPATSQFQNNGVVAPIFYKNQEPVPSLNQD